MKRRAPFLAFALSRALSLAALLVTAPAPAGGFDAAPAIPDVVLADTRGGEWRLPALLAGRPVLLSFFFTGCASLCPVQTATMQGVRAELKRRGVAPDAVPLMLSVSLDPFGDTPESIERYAAGFGIALGREAGWLMLNGRPADLDRVRAAFEEPAGLAGDHTGVLWLWEPGARRWSPLLALGEPGKIADRLVEGAAP